jgi:hypothetical protein
MACNSLAEAQNCAMLGETEDQFSLTRAAFVPAGAQKPKFSFQTTGWRSLLTRQQQRARAGCAYLGHFGSVTMKTLRAKLFTVAAAGMVFLALAAPAAAPLLLPLLGSLELTNEISLIQVSGDYAYARVLDSSLQTNVLIAADISNIATPKVVGSCAHLQISALPIGVGNMVISSNLVCVAAGRLEVVDRSDPGRPSLVGTWATADPSGVADVCLAGRLAYVATGTNGLQVVDLSEPAHPQLVGQIAFSNFQAHAVAIQGQQAVVLCDPLPPGYQRLFVLDTSQVQQPVVMGYCDLTPPLPGGGYAAALCVSGRYAYVGSYWQFFLAYVEAKVLVVDLGNPNQPVTIGNASFGGYSRWPFRLVQQDGLVFFECNVQGVAIANVRVPTTPLIPSYLPLSQYPSDVRVSKDRLYVGSRTELLIYAFPSAVLAPPMVSNQDVAVSWNTNGLGMRLERTTQLSPANWQDVPGATTTNSLTLPRSGTSALFRLSYP